MFTERKPTLDPADGSISTRIPSITTFHPQLWSTLAELELKNYTATRDKSRFRWVAGCPSIDLILQIGENISSSRSYKALKETVITRAALTEVKRVR